MRDTVFDQLSIDDAQRTRAIKTHQHEVNGSNGVLLADHDHALDVLREMQDTAYWLGWRRGYEAALIQQAQEQSQ